MRRLPFHPKDGVGPKSIILTPEMAKHNSRVLLQHADRLFSTGPLNVFVPVRYQYHFSDCYYNLSERD